MLRTHAGRLGAFGTSGESAFAAFGTVSNTYATLNDAIVTTDDGTRALHRFFFRFGVFH